MYLIYSTDTVQMQEWKIIQNSLIRVRDDGTAESVAEAKKAGATPGQIEAAEKVRIVSS